MLAYRKRSDAGRLTRELRAALLGVSVPTANRILAGKGVDRATLVHAFSELGLPWKDEYCSLCRDEEEADWKSSQQQDQRSQEAAPTQANPLHSGRRRLFVAAALGLMLVGLFWSLQSPVRVYLRDQRAHDLESDFIISLQQGTRAYHEARYTQARAFIERAIQRAQDLSSADKLSLALRMAGDIEAACGDLRRGLGLLQTAAELRELLHDEVHLPAIYEAMGELNTRSGNPRSAEAILLRARDGYTKMGDLNGVAACERDLGSALHAQGKLSEARKWFGAAMKKAQAHGATDLLVDITARNALVDRDLKKWSDAETTLESCLAHWKARGHKRWIAETEMQLATVKLAESKRGEGKGLLDDSYRNFTAVGDTYGASKCLSLLGTEQGR
ncbi:MAG: hypothetical protein KIS66_06320 [Fimbriimonadaceae bacterium]|nr:hypothetical protein [Fimbriimonadaceae bacterium]